MRSAWFEHVRKTRRKLTRERKEAVSHREAMSIASTSWSTEKIRLRPQDCAGKTQRGKVGATR